MSDQRDGLSPDDPEWRRVHIRDVIEFWSQFDVCGESGATTLEVLDELRLEVTDALGRDPPDVDRAMRLTAEALCRIEGIQGQ